MKIMKSDLAGHGMSQQLRTLVFKKIKFREEELTPSENVDSSTCCRHKQRQPGKMNDLAYFCREPKNVLPAENNNNR